MMRGDDPNAFQTVPKFRMFGLSAIHVNIRKIKESQMVGRLLECSPCKKDL